MAEGDGTPSAIPANILQQLLPMMQGGGAPPQATSVAPQQSPLGPTNPVQSQADPQQIAAQAMQRGTQLTEQQLGIANPAAAEATSIAKAPYQTRNPVYGTWSGVDPNTPPSQPQGGFLHTLGRALLALGEATTPGQTIMAQRYAGQRSAREDEEAGRAEKISALQKQAQLAEEPVGATAKMGPQYMTAAAKQESAEAATSRANTAAGNLKERISNDAISNSIKWKNLGIKEQALALKETLSRLGMQVTMRGQDINFGTREDAIAAVTAVQGTKIWNELDTSLKAKLMQWTGMSDLGVPSAQSPGKVIPKEGAAPGDVGRRQPPPKPGEKSAPPKGATHIGKGPDGKRHYADAQGNDLGLVP